MCTDDDLERARLRGFEQGCIATEKVMSKEIERLRAEVFEFITTVESSRGLDDVARTVPAFKRLCTEVRK